MPLTIRDVALVAGVSPSTVSRALRGLQNVDPLTRDRIVAIAREMDFAVSPTASRLATGRTGTIGIVTPFVGRWYFTEVFAGIEEVLKVHDVDLLLHTTDAPEASDSPWPHVRLRRRVDGAIVIGMTPASAELDALAATGMPLVMLGSRPPGTASVSIDDRAGSRAAVAHLVERGHELVGLVTGRPLPTPFVPENDRLAGYLDVLAEHGLPHGESLREVGLFTTSGGEHAMTRLLARRPRPTAVFCMSDEMAYGAIRAIRRVGLRTGGDTAAGEIAMVGFDGHDLAEIFDLSTVHQPVRALGRAAAAQLMAQMQGRHEGRVTVLPTELIVRGTSAGC